MTSGSLVMPLENSQKIAGSNTKLFRSATILWIASISGYDKETACSFHNKANDDCWNIRGVYWKPVRYSYVYKISPLYSWSIGHFDQQYGIAIQSSDFNIEIRSHVCLRS